MLKPTVGFLLAFTLIAFFTSPALAGDEERS
jgi:biotin transporter BioY